MHRIVFAAGLETKVVVRPLDAAVGNIDMAATIKIEPITVIVGLILNIQPVLKSVFCNHNICALMVWGGASVYSVYSVVDIYLYILYHLRMERITYESMGKSLSMLDGDFAEYLRSYQ